MTIQSLEKEGCIEGSVARMSTGYNMHKNSTSGEMTSEITMDEELRALVPPLTDDERALLEQSIIEEGCRDPLVVWKGHGTLLDGHHRHAICTKHGIPYKVIEIELEDWDGAKIWMIRNQRGRRNLTRSQLDDLIGIEYNLTKKSHGGVRERVSTSQNGKMPYTCERIAEEHGISKNTVLRNAEYSQGIDAIAEATGNREVRRDIVDHRALSKTKVKEVADKVICDPSYRQALADAAKTMSIKQAVKIAELKSAESSEANGLEKEGSISEKIIDSMEKPPNSPGNSPNNIVRNLLCSLEGLLDAANVVMQALNQLPDDHSLVEKFGDKSPASPDNRESLKLAVTYNGKTLRELMDAVEAEMAVSSQVINETSEEVRTGIAEIEVRQLPAPDETKQLPAPGIKALHAMARTPELPATIEPAETKTIIPEHESIEFTPKPTATPAALPIAQPASLKTVNLDGVEYSLEEAKQRLSNILKSYDVDARVEDADDRRFLQELFGVGEKSELYVIEDENKNKKFKIIYEGGREVIIESHWRKVSVLFNSNKARVPQPLVQHATA
jgi:hypothetical protein